MNNEVKKSSKSISKNMLLNAFVLGLFAIVGTALVAYVNEITKDQVAANIRAVRPPEPYKGKGIRYVDEHVRRKAGKAGVSA